MEKAKLSLHLIRNTYEVDDAKEVITQLLSDKINFIRRQIFSLDERYGINSSYLENRLKELNQSKEDIVTFFKSINSEELEVKIDCPVNIELVEKTQNTSAATDKKETAWT